eukprot:296541_1
MTSMPTQLENIPPNTIDDIHSYKEAIHLLTNKLQTIQLENKLQTIQLENKLQTIQLENKKLRYETQKLEDTRFRIPSLTKSLAKAADRLYQNKDVNVRNLGIYAKNAADGWWYCNIQQVGHGYVKFGCDSRTFCEVLCNYLLKGKKSNQKLQNKLDAVQKMKISNGKNMFPYTEMNQIRKKTNKIVHSIGYNEDAKNRYLSSEDQYQTLENMCSVAWWAHSYV